MTTSSHGWRTPQNFLLLISIIVPIAFSTWMALLNNFVIEKANFDGADIGLLQSVREIPGFFWPLPPCLYCCLSESNALCSSLWRCLRLVRH